jgi:hypothetical protein
VQNQSGKQSKRSKNRVVTSDGSWHFTALDHDDAEDAYEAIVSRTLQA